MKYDMPMMILCRIEITGKFDSGKIVKIESWLELIHEARLTPNFGTL